MNDIQYNAENHVQYGIIAIPVRSRRPVLPITRSSKNSHAVIRAHDIAHYILIWLYTRALARITAALARQRIAGLYTVGTLQISCAACIRR